MTLPEIDLTLFIDSWLF